MDQVWITRRVPVEEVWITRARSVDTVWITQGLSTGSTRGLVARSFGFHGVRRPRGVDLARRAHTACTGHDQQG